MSANNTVGARRLNSLFLPCPFLLVVENGSIVRQRHGGEKNAGGLTLTAELLNSSNNFIPNRLNNLDRVIDYITENKTSLQAEFGLGDAARPSAEVSKALAAYNRIYGI